MSEECIRISEVEARYSKSVRTVQFKTKQLQALFPEELNGLSQYDIGKWIEENFTHFAEVLREKGLVEDLDRVIGCQDPDYHDDDPSYIGHHCNEQRGWDHSDDAEEIDLDLDDEEEDLEDY